MSASDFKRRAEERKRTNGMIDSPGCLVIFYPPNYIASKDASKEYAPKKMGMADGSLYLYLSNGMVIMLPKDRCVVIDPNGTPLINQYKKPMFGGIEVGPEEDIPSVLYDAYSNGWLEVPITIPPNNIPKTEEDKPNE
jgi:hypothetical protein